MKFDGESIYELRLKPGCTRSRRAVRLACDVPRCQQVAQANPAKKLSPDTVRNCIDYLRAVLRRVNVYAEGSFAKGRVDHLYDSVCDRRDIRIGRHDGAEALEHLVRESCIGTRFVFSGSCLIRGRPSM